MRTMRLRSRQMILIGLILLEIFLIWLLVHREMPINEVDWLHAYSTETDEFRAMDFGDGVLEKAFELAGQWDANVYEILAAQLVSEAVKSQNGNGGLGNAAISPGDSGSAADSGENGLPDYREFLRLAEQMNTEKPIEWLKLVNGFQTILADVRYFPVALGEEGLAGLSYENGWGDARTYGGDRLHEGTDIMDVKNIRGSYPIVSMTDGVVEHVGWLEQGGYRIGIRSPHGAYFYYAHLSAYAEEFAVGQRVTAGQLIGFMGDTGYSTVEGTVGNFPVHLHLGIYLETDHYAELSVNPYYILKYSEKNTVSYANDTYLWYNRG